MRKAVVLITGAGGEIGHGLVRGLAEQARAITLDAKARGGGVTEDPFARPSTMPSGGTSDDAPEMMHAAATGGPSACWRRPPRERLMWTAYNVGACSRSAAEIRDAGLPAFPNAQITYKIDQKRQGIVDSWLADVDDSAARTDWGFSPEYDFDRAFREYLIPSIGNDYRS